MQAGVGSMMRKLSAAIGRDRSGTASPRVHPSDDGGSEGAAGMEAAAGLEAAPSARQSARGPSPLHVVVEEPDQSDESLRERHQRQALQQEVQPPAQGEQRHSQGELSFFESASSASSPQADCVVGVSAAAGDAATLALASSISHETEIVPIPAVRKSKAMRISFADTATVMGPHGIDTTAAATGPPGEGGAPKRGRLSSLLHLGGKPAVALPRQSFQQRQSIMAVHPQRVPSAGESEADSSDRKSSVFDLLDRKKGGPESRWRAALLRFLQSGSFLLVSLTLTIMILYSDSLRMAAAPASLDPAFLAFTLFVLGFFTLEAAATCLANPRYFRSFYFWVDVVATFSILIDIPVLMDPLYSSANDGNGDVQQRSGMENAAQITAASTRAARLAQVTKWMRLWRIVKLWTFYYKNKQHIIDRQTFMETELEASSQSRVGEKLTELTIRKVILMILLVMFAMPVFNVSVGYYGGAPMLDSGGLRMLHAVYGQTGNNSAFQQAMQVYTSSTTFRLGRGYTGFLKDLVVFNNTYVAVPGGVLGLRESEYVKFSDETCVAEDECYTSYVTFDMKWDSQIQGLLEIGRTTFTIMILLLGAVVFIRDTDRLVLKPLERMVQLLKEVSENPLARLKHHRNGGGRAGSVVSGHSDSVYYTGGLAADAAAAVAAVAADAKEAKRMAKKRRPKTEKALETQVLESSIHKICSLLSVGFGEAGAEVIADNMRSGGDLNPMVPGRKVAAIFGFCDIRNFTDATEVLQEEVMEFVNSIAQIVHQEVALHGGAANKNIGDAFLLVWKLSGKKRHEADASRRDSVTRSRSQGSGISRASRDSSGTAERLSVLYGGNGGSMTEGHGERKPFAAEDAVSAMADQALASFIVIQAALKRSAKLREYSAREDLNRRMPGYEVNMGFGLHVGWAIEGAIGSEYKIDASYLSPHVNMASRLEAATKQYGASILLSDDFVRMLSPGVRAMVRQIDCVTVKGSNKPVGLFTYDVDAEGLESMRLSQLRQLKRLPSTMSGEIKRMPSSALAAASSIAADVAAATAAEEGTSKAMPPAPPVVAAGLDRYETFSNRVYADEYAEHPDIVMTKAVDAEFLTKFGTGFDAYKKGDWHAARAVLEETLEMRRDRRGRAVTDGPSKVLLRVMGEHRFESPPNWAGFRELTDK